MPSCNHQRPPPWRAALRARQLCLPTQLSADAALSTAELSRLCHERILSNQTSGVEFEKLQTQLYKSPALGPRLWVDVIQRNEDRALREREERRKKRRGPEEEEEETDEDEDPDFAPEGGETATTITEASREEDLEDSEDGETA